MQEAEDDDEEDIDNPAKFVTQVFIIEQDTSQPNSTIYNARLVGLTAGPRAK